MNTDLFSLSGKVALVTGGSRGLGRQIAIAFARVGADVAVSSRSLPLLEEVAGEIEQIGQRGLAVAADVSKAQDVAGLVQKVLDRFGVIDVLVNNAGVSPTFTRALKVSEGDWRRVLDVNLTGTFLVCQAVSPHMIAAGGGSIINIVSVGARVGLPRLAAYCASKAGIEGLTRVLALELVEHNVRVNAIGPGYLSTDMTEGVRQHSFFYSQILQRTPMRRIAEPDEVAGTAIFLASQAASFLTGQTIFVDGGWLAM